MFLRHKFDGNDFLTETSDISLVSEGLRFISNSLVKLAKLKQFLYQPPSQPPVGLGHVLRMKDDRLPKVVLFGQPSGATWKAVCSRLGWEEVINKSLENGNFLGGCKEGGLE